jgi:spore germination cell wall hydrolase CwlJ-like protein
MMKPMSLKKYIWMLCAIVTGILFILPPDNAADMALLEETYAKNVDKTVPTDRTVFSTVDLAKEMDKEKRLQNLYSFEEKKRADEKKRIETKKIMRQKSGDHYWLAKIIEAEAQNQSFRGKVAVGSVVLNRVRSGEFPKTIKGVIFQQYRGHYQFQPVANGRIHRVSVSKSSALAAAEALNGVDPTHGSLYFYNPKIARSKWIRTRSVKIKIGDHSFAG